MRNQLTSTPSVPVDATPQSWFVEMPSPPVADGTNLNTTKREKDTFRANAVRAGLVYSERRSFDKLWNGLSITVDKSQLSALSRIPGVNAIYPVGTYAMPSTSENGATPNMAYALAMTGADIAQNSLGLTGQGIKVGVIDTGIDYHHPDLGGCFGPGCRVSKGYDFVGDAYNNNTSSPDYNPVPSPDNDPDDCLGHGTHVAGIVGANGVIKGVAPQVTLGAYRVFGCSGSTSSDIILAAMERALDDGMQVVNLSLGSTFEWPQSPTAQAGDRLVNKGVVVVASIGNSGGEGLYSAGSPGVGKKVIGVASFQNSHTEQRRRYFTVSPGGRQVSFEDSDAPMRPPTSGAFEMARTGTQDSTNDACDPLPTNSLAGKVALIRRGGCFFKIKVVNAQNAGALGVVIYNNADGILTIQGIDSTVWIPAVMITAADGVALDDLLATGPVSTTWVDETGIFPDPMAGLINSFSSYGMSPDLSLKPDLAAPGGGIYSTNPIENGSYRARSGTSMASPHVAGAVALLLQARPNTPSNAVRTILQNSADPTLWSTNPSLGFLDNVHRQGAGALDIDDAILSTTRIEPASLALGESEQGPVTRMLTLKNDSASEVTYSLSHAPAQATGPNTWQPTFLNAPANASFAVAGLPAAAVTIPAGGTATVQVTISPDETLADFSLYGGYIVFTPQQGGALYRVPYAGLKGDYQAIQVLSTEFDLPWLMKWNGFNYEVQPEGATYNMQGDDIPAIGVRLNHQARRLKLEVFDLAGNSWHRAFQQDYVGRPTEFAYYFEYPWDGKTTNGNKTFTVPDGQYVIKLSVLKALGDSANPAHTETWTSPVITIDRP